MSSVAATVPLPVPEVPDLAALDAAGRVQWAVDTFGGELILTTSFGVQSAVMLHLVTQIVPRVPVVFIDTGYLFPETYRFAEELRERLDLNLRVYQPQMTAARQEALFGKRWELGAEELKRYNLDNKVEPMDRAVRELGATAWLAGLRRSQASSREQLPVVQRQNKVTKIHPIIDWSNRDVHLYLTEHELPYHPLWEQGFVSIGDWHSTTPLTAGMAEEDTRFGGQKRECGLHELSGQPDFQI